MVKKIQKVYLSKALLIVSSALAICCYLFDAISTAVSGQFADYAWIFLCLVVLLQWAFFKGQINVQKMLFGAMLLMMVKEQAELLVLNASYNGSVFPEDIAFLAIAVIIFVCHIYQQMDHAGKSLAVLLNQLIGFVAFVFLFYAIRNLIAYPESLSSYVFLFGYVFNSVMVICMETRVGVYKQIRDKARTDGTWTEENRREAKKLFKL